MGLRILRQQLPPPASEASASLLTQERDAQALPEDAGGGCVRQTAPWSIALRSRDAPAEPAAASACECAARGPVFMARFVAVAVVLGERVLELPEPWVSCQCSRLEPVAVDRWATCRRLRATRCARSSEATPLMAQIPARQKTASRVTLPSRSSTKSSCKDRSTRPGHASQCAELEVSAVVTRDVIRCCR